MKIFCVTHLKLGIILKTAHNQMYNNTTHVVRNNISLAKCRKICKTRQNYIPYSSYGTTASIDLSICLYLWYRQTQLKPEVYIQLFRSSNSFSTGLRSGLCHGCAKTLTLLPLSHFVTTLTLLSILFFRSICTQALTSWLMPLDVTSIYKRRTCI